MKRHTESELAAPLTRYLVAQGYTLSSVPPVGQRVLVRRNPPYFKNGGNLVDLTDRIK